MSMLSAQCDELRDKAKLLRGHVDGLKAPYVIPSTKELMMLTMLDSAMRMEEAADTIISLRDRLQDAVLGSGTCKITATATNNLMYPDYMTKWYELSCGHSLTLKGDEAPKWCAVCGKAVER